MLAALLPGDLFGALLVFVRIGAAMMLLPGIGEPYVSARVRLLLALSLSLLVAPVLSDTLPALPDSPALLGLLILGEAVIGIFLGTMTRFFMAALTTAGMMIAYSSALANALVNDPSAAQQGSIAGSFLTLVALLVIFALDLHHLMLRALVESYQLFAPGEALPIGDFSETIARVMAKTFLLSFQIAAPFIAVSTIFYLGIGLLSRLMPQVQIFFVAMPLQMTLGLMLIAITLAGAATWFLEFFGGVVVELRGGV